MKPKGLLVAVVVLAVLGGLIWWSNKKQAAASKTSTDTTTKLLSIPDDQFQEIKIKKLTGELQDLRRVNGKWQLTQPVQLPADPDTVGSMVSSLSSLNADKLIEDKASRPPALRPAHARRSTSPSSRKTARATSC